MKLADKDIKTVIINVLYMFKRAEGNMNTIRQIAEINFLS